MAKREKMKRKSKVMERLEQMTPEEMRARWADMRPRYLMWLGMFVLAAAILFLSNHIQHFQQGVLNVVNVAFQICCIFVVLFGMLTAMSFIYGREPKKQGT